MKNGPFEEVFLIQDRHLAFTMLWIAMKGKFHCQRLHKCGTPKPTMVVYLRRSVKLTIGDRCQDHSRSTEEQQVLYLQCASIPAIFDLTITSHKTNTRWPFDFVRFGWLWCEIVRTRV